MTNEACRIICAAIIGGSIVLSSFIISVSLNNDSGRYSFGKETYYSADGKTAKERAIVFDSKTGKRYVQTWNDKMKKKEFRMTDYVTGESNLLTK